MGVGPPCSLAARGYHAGFEGSNNDLDMIRDINLQSMLYDAVLDGSPHIELFVNSIPDLQRPLFPDAIKGAFRPAKVGEIFGPSWVNSFLIPSLYHPT